MRLLISAASALALACALLAACGPSDTSGTASNAAATTARAGGPNIVASGATAGVAQQPPAQPGDDVARVTQDQLNDLMRKGAAVLYDVRDKASYEKEHIKGAKNVPLDEVEKRLAEFPKDKQIVTYCA